MFLMPSSNKTGYAIYTGVTFSLRKCYNCCARSYAIVVVSVVVFVVAIVGVIIFLFY